MDETAAVKDHRLTRPIQPPKSAFAGFRFPSEVILIAVRWYLRYGLSGRDLEELLAQRGIEVDHVTLFRWVQRFTPLLIDARHGHTRSPFIAPMPHRPLLDCLRPPLDQVNMRFLAN